MNEKISPRQALGFVRLGLANAGHEHVHGILTAEMNPAQLSALVIEAVEAHAQTKRRSDAYRTALLAIEQHFHADTCSLVLDSSTACNCHVSTAHKALQEEATEDALAKMFDKGRGPG